MLHLCKGCPNMSIAVLTSLFVLYSVLGLEVEGANTGARTFENFDSSKWNPVNWFGLNQSRNELKLNALFKIVNCLSENERTECGDVLQEARSQFEPNPSPETIEIKTDAPNTEKPQS